MTTAFQPGAYQSDAFQIEGGVNTPVSVSDAFQGFQQNAFQATGGLPALNGASGVISWTQDNQSWALNGSLRDNDTISWTQGNQVWSLAGKVSQSITVSWTQDSQVWALLAVASNDIFGTIGWTGDSDSWAVSGNVSQNTVSLIPQVYGLKPLSQSSKKRETDEEKRLRREAQGIIARVKTSKGDDKPLFDDAVDVVAEIRREIDRLGIKAAWLERQQQTKLMIEAQLQAEQLQAQIEEIDTAFMMFMIIAHLD